MPVSHDEDIRLARQLLDGHMEAFDAFVENFRTRIFQYSYLMCGHREDAEEVAQDALLNAFSNFHSLREPQNVRSWIFRIAKNACLMKRRKSVFAPAHEISLDAYMEGDSDGHGREPAGEFSMPDDELYREELHRALGDAIQRLPEMYRAVVLLRDVEELSTEETAEILDLSRDVVKQRLHRARMALRKLLSLHLQSTGGRS